MEVRRWRAEKAVREVVWLVLIFAEMRYTTPTTRRLADICGVRGKYEFGTFRQFIRKHLVEVGKKIDPVTGFENVVWGRPPT